jgi:hypothetical protein
MVERGDAWRHKNIHEWPFELLYDTVYYYMIKEIADSAWMREHM